MSCAGMHAATWSTSSALLLGFLTHAPVIGLQSTPLVRVPTYSKGAARNVAVRAPRRSCLSTGLFLGNDIELALGGRESGCGGNKSKISMAFDFGHMVKQMMGSATGGSGGGGSKKEVVYDAAIVGYGPAGGVMATLLAEKHGLKVCIIDPNLEKRWIPNYGVWLEEWESLDRDLQIGLGDCLERTWEVTDSFFGGSNGVPAAERCRIRRAYGRVSRDKMQANLKARLAAAGVTKIRGTADPMSIEHFPEGTSLRLDEGERIKCRLLVDCSGHKSELVERSGVDNPGVQIAYGVEVEVKDGHAPYDENAMLFMDYRTDYVDEADLSADELRELNEVPTFLYAMPLGKAPNGRRKIFFEETSLVARPPISFDLCKERLARRLKHHGIEITKIMDEEFCYIPMGGAMPKLDQRVVAFGGASSLVHAATGYMHVRMLAAAGGVARAIATELKTDGPGAPAAAAGRAYQALWPARARLQRDFHVFGGEFLMAQQAPILRGFFNGFFKLPMPLWAGFLSGYPNLPHNELHQDWRDRLGFGFQFFLKLAPPVQVQLMLAGVLNGWRYGLIRSVSPLAAGEDVKDLRFGEEIESIRIAAAASAAATSPAALRVAREPGQAEVESLVGVNGEADEKELVVM